MFCIRLKSGKDLYYVAQNRFDFVNWTDGIRVWMGMDVENSETLDDLKVLVDTEIEVKLLDLEGVSIPSSAPAVPPPPPNYDFFFKDADELANKPKQETKQDANAWSKGIALGKNRGK